MANKNEQMSGAYADPKLTFAPIALANGSSNNAWQKESSKVVNDAMGELQTDPDGFNRNLNKRIKRADNIAQQTRLNIKLDKKEQRQEKRAQKMLDKNPEYANRAAEKSAQANAKQAMLQQIVSNPLLPINKTK